MAGRVFGRVRICGSGVWAGLEYMEIWRGIINLLNGRKSLWTRKNLMAGSDSKCWNHSFGILILVNERNLKPMTPNYLCKKGKEGQLE
ncbi:unnamed protein product [Rhizophagus irregularis]|nr:unnamed protein product [Rhizophagus irregularis]